MLEWGSGAERSHLSSARRREHAAEVHEWALLERWQQRVGERRRRGALLGARRVHKQAIRLRLYCLHPKSFGKWWGLETKEQLVTPLVYLETIYQLFWLLELAVD